MVITKNVQNMTARTLHSELQLHQIKQIVAHTLQLYSHPSMHEAHNENITTGPIEGGMLASIPTSSPSANQTDLTPLT